MSTTIIATSDTHGEHRQLVVPKCDVFIHAGDFTNLGEIDVIHDFFRWLGTIPAKEVVFIAGNHDIGFEHMSTSMLGWLIALPSHIHYLKDSSVLLRCGLRVYGSPWTNYISNRWEFQLPLYDDITGEYSDAIFGNIPKSTDILVTHAPPKNILSGKWGNKRLEKLSAHVPLHIFGHIHECCGAVQTDATMRINAARTLYRIKDLTHVQAIQSLPTWPTIPV